MTEAVITGAMARSYEVMKRQSVSYDYEKVFFNSAYGLGLVGLGWMAVKLGGMIAGLQKATEAAQTSFDWTFNIGDYQDRSIFEMYVEYVEGDKKNVSDLIGVMQYIPSVYIYRSDSTQWEAYKTDFAANHPEYFVTDANGDLVYISVVKADAKAKENALKILESADKFYAVYGSIMPLGILIGNVGLEYIRVWRLKNELRDR